MIRYCDCGTMFGPRFSIIIPAHNEALRIGPVLSRYAKQFADSEILVVLNGCRDGTLAVVSEISKGCENLAYVEVKDAIGKGGAVRLGMLFARAPVVGYVDADGSTPAEEMRRLCDSIGDLDGIIASRWLTESKVDAAQPFLRRCASRAFNFCVRLLFGLPFNDTQCGAKVFRAQALRSVLTKVETSNLAFDVDLLHHLLLRGNRIYEAPTVWNDVTGSRVQLFSASRKMLMALLRLRLKDSFFRMVIPTFDRILPTAPIRMCDGLAVLILNWRDPEHPQAGGAENYLWSIGKRLVAAGHTVEWLTASFPGAKKVVSRDGIKITRVGNRLTVYLAAAVEYLSHFRDRFDVIIDTENGIPFFSPLFSLKPKICLMLHVHQRIFEKHLAFPLSTLLKWIERRLVPLIYQNVSFVAISQDTKNEMLSLQMTKRPLPVIYPGYDEALVPGIRSVAPMLAYVGRLKDYKRVNLLIQALPMVLRSCPDITLRILGDGDALPTLRELVRALDLDSVVTFEGFVSEQRKREVLQAAWLFVSPSEMEGWGIAAIEANACGTPAVVFDVPGLREAVVDGFCGVILQENESLGQALVDLLTDAAFLERLRAGAVENASKYSWDSSAAAFESVLVSSVAGERATLVRSPSGWSLLRHQPSAALVTREAVPLSVERFQNH